MLKVSGQQLMHVWGDEESSYVKGFENKWNGRRRCERCLCGLLGNSKVNL